MLTASLENELTVPVRAGKDSSSAATKMREESAEELKKYGIDVGALDLTPGREQKVLPEELEHLGEVRPAADFEEVYNSWIKGRPRYEKSEFFRRGLLKRVLNKFRRQKEENKSDIIPD